MTTLTLDEVRIVRKGYSMPVAVDDARFFPDSDDLMDGVKFNGNETTDDNSNDDEFFDG